MFHLVDNLLRDPKQEASSSAAPTALANVCGAAVSADMSFSRPNATAASAPPSAHCCRCSSMDVASSTGLFTSCSHCLTNFLTSISACSPSFRAQMARRRRACWRICGEAGSTGTSASVLRSALQLSITLSKQRIAKRSRLRSISKRPNSTQYSKCWAHSPFPAVCMSAASQAWQASSNSPLCCNFSASTCGASLSSNGFSLPSWK
mmetsp:Transcript_37569/g.86790  ORF Transcript_37569/g.86790 Transcript_37569/m.86790 type:complete len:206 (+) Transcript_37569:361-978(+)